MIKSKFGPSNRIGEVEAAVRNSEGIRQAVALVREDVPSDKRLVCYIVPFDRAAFSLGGLRTFLRTKLPEYMIPSRYVLLDSLPLTSNGKINRPALPGSCRTYLTGIGRLLRRRGIR